MRTLSIPIPVVLAFLLVAARVASLFVFFPVPGVRALPAAPKIVFSLLVTAGLLPFWPRVEMSQATLGWLATALIAEAVLGLTMGLFLAFLSEGLTLAMQILGLQAGYGYATTIDPTSEADSGILPVIAQLAAGMLFFAMGLDRLLIAALARSLDTLPPGGWFAISPEALTASAMRLGTAMFTFALRLALPVVALLLVIDLSLALVSRFNQQLQLLTVAFPAKMLAALALTALLVPAWVRLYQSQATTVFRAIGEVTAVPVRHPVQVRPPAAARP